MQLLKYILVSIGILVAFELSILCYMAFCRMRIRQLERQFEKEDPEAYKRFKLQMLFKEYAERLRNQEKT